MRKILLASLCLLLFVTSCIDKVNTESVKVNIEAVQTLADFQIPVQSGKATIVTLGNDTLAVTTFGVNTKVPKYALAENLLSVTYSDDPKFTGGGQQTYADGVFGSATLRYWQYLSFEDTPNADYDYNDLVVHVRFERNKHWKDDLWTNIIRIQPIALGSSVNRVIKLGISYKDPQGVVHTEILVDDVRKTLFNGSVEFPINTSIAKGKKVVSDKMVKFFENETDYEMSIVWFIEVSGSRFYAVSSENGIGYYDMFTRDGLPYGLSFTKVWDYPSERVSISLAYPGFDAWLINGDETAFLDSQVRDNVFPAVSRGGGDFSLWDYDRVMP